MYKKLFLIMVVGIFMISLASASFLPIKTYDDETKTFTLSNFLGLGKDYASGTLTWGDTRVGVGIDTHVGTFTYTPLDDSAYIDDLGLINKKNGNVMVRGSQYKVLTYKEDDNYITICTTQNTNGTNYEDCYLEEDGKITIEEWKPLSSWLNQNDFIVGETYTIGVFVDTEIGDYGDWIPTIMNFQIDEWSSWTADMFTNLLSYHRMNETSGTAVQDSQGNYSHTTSGTTLNQVGKLDEAFEYDGSSDYTYGSGYYDFDNGNYISVCQWIYTTNTAKAEGQRTWEQHGGGWSGLFFSINPTSYLSMQVGNGVDSITVAISNTTVQNNTWNFICATATRNDAIKIYIDGVIVEEESLGNAMGGSLNGNIYIGRNHDPNTYFVGLIDDTMVWNRELSGTEIETLYNNGEGLSPYLSYDDPPTATLYSPIDEYNSTSQTNNLVWNATDDFNLVNVSLIVDDIYIYTNSTPTNATAQTYNYDFGADGTYAWKIEACDNVSQCTNATARNINIDSVVPVIFQHYPKGYINYLVAGDSLDLNFSVTESNPDTCFYDYNGTNYSISCTANSSIIYEIANNNLTFWVNDTFGNANSTIFNWNVLLAKESELYTSSIVEGGSSNFITNFYTNGTDINIANFSYNGVSTYGSIAQTGDNFTIYTSKVAPSVSADTNVSWYWIIQQDGGFSTSTTSQNQTIINLLADDCSVYNESVLYNITILDEATQSKLVNTTAEVDLTLYSSDRSSTILTYNGTYTNVNPFGICISNNLSNGEVYSLDAQIQYEADDHEIEYYHIQNSTITNTDFTTNFSLYDLLNTTSQVFVISYKDSNFLPVKDALIQIQRKYVGEGVFKVVEIPKTDSDGQTLGHLVLADVIYTFVVTKNGQNLATFDNFLANCESELLGDCTINLNEPSSFISPDDYTNTEDFSFTLTYDNSTKTIQSIFVVTSGTPSIVVLNATLSDELGSNEVCSDTLTSASGTLECVVPSSFGNSTIQVTLTKDGEVVGQGYRSTMQDPSQIYGGSIAFILIFLYLTLFGVALSDNPLVTGISLFVGGVLAVVLNVVKNTGFIGAGATILWLLIAIVIVLIKGSNRQ